MHLLPYYYNSFISAVKFSNRLCIWADFDSLFS